MSRIDDLYEAAKKAGPRGMYPRHWRFCSECGEKVHPFAFERQEYFEGIGERGEGLYRKVYKFTCPRGHTWEDAEFINPTVEWERLADPQTVMALVEVYRAALAEANDGPQEGDTGAAQLHRTMVLRDNLDAALSKVVALDGFVDARSGGPDAKA